MKKIIQYTDHDQIRRLAYDGNIFCMKPSNDKGKMDLIKLSTTPPHEINQLLKDDDNMFIIIANEK